MAKLVCLIWLSGKLLMVLASTVILGSESRRTHESKFVGLGEVIEVVSNFEALRLVIILTAQLTPRKQDRT
jgi:hypothetical protein